MAKTSETSTPPPQGLQDLLGTDVARPWWRRPVTWLAPVLLVAAGAAWLVWQDRQTQSKAPSYVTEPVRKGDITLIVSANGTLQPTRSVNIGSELSGTVKQVLVDVNDRVKKGDVMVVLDTAKLSDQVDRSTAALLSAQAQVTQAAATVKESRTNLARLDEVARLSGGKVPSVAELDTARAGLERAIGAEASALASVTQARATLSTDQTNLGKASIRSPIDGVVLSRTVDPGNAVAASLQAVTLFSVAEDLRRLRLEVAVDEADVGSVRVDQKASFTVSAYPSRRYPAEVTRVAFGSTKTENVVTYMTWLAVDNTDLSLRPGMTAAASIVATERRGVLLVPNTALRFSPSNGGAAAEGGGSILSKLMPGPPRVGPRKKAGGNGTGERRVWVLKDGQAVSVPVKLGISDGRSTEIIEGELEEGALIITDQRSAGAPS
ncbi:MAG: hypothetical protein RLZZ591_1521 [Pseudomonadota bacterium]|jgi:HlyD family secretion protein